MSAISPTKWRFFLCCANLFVVGAKIGSLTLYFSPFFSIFAFKCFGRVNICKCACILQDRVVNIDDKKGQEVSQGDYRHIVKYLSIFGGAQGISMFLNIVRNKFASILLGANGLGLIALYNRTIQMFSDCTNLSLSFSAVRKMSDVYENGSVVDAEHCVKIIRSVAFLTGLVGTLLFLLASPFLSKWIFGSYGYYASRFAMLSPVVLFMAVSGGEVAILRGVRQLNKIALYSVWTAVSAVAAAVPLYYFMGLGGIFPAMFLIAFMQMAGVLYFSKKLYRYRISPFSLALLREGIDMVKLGVGYIYASILTSCSIWLICKALSEIGNGTVTGLFSAGFVLVSMLPSILFAALDSDYYPRLSGIFCRSKERNTMINEQIEVHILVQTPIILGFIVVLPELLPLLYTHEFMPALKMTQIAMFALMLNTLTYPMSFMPLSKGDSFTFLVQESVYNVSFVVFVVLGYYRHGLVGIGLAMALARVVDFVTVYSIAWRKYSFRLSGRVVRYFLINVFIALFVFYSAFEMKTGAKSWVLGLGSVACSGMVSLYMLARHGNMLYKIYSRVFKRK